MSEHHPQVPELRKGKSGRLTRKVFEFWPLVIWLVVAAACFWAFTRGVQFKRMNGTVATYQITIAPEDSGFIKDIRVKPGESVKAGDVVAILDTTELEQRKRQLEESLTFKRFEQTLEFQDAVNDAIDDLDDLAFDEKQLDAEIEIVAAELAALDEQLTRGLIERTDVENVRIKLEKLRKQKDFFPERREQINKRKLAAEQILAQAKETARLEADIAESVEMQMLDTRIKGATLTSPVDGEVYEVDGDPNEYVSEGETIVRIVERAEHIVGFLPQEQLEAVKPGGTVYVTTTNDRYNFIETTVESLSPRIDSAPDTASPLPNKVIRGRRVFINLPEGSDLMPGQTVVIHLEKPGKWDWLEFDLGSMQQN
ncbi:MAG: HlyD family efflux transporter periplasmic adaptor subunit [Verrucomicrobiales bacterium]